MKPLHTKVHRFVSAPSSLVEFRFRRSYLRLLSFALPFQLSAHAWLFSFSSLPNLLQVAVALIHIHIVHAVDNERR